MMYIVFRYTQTALVLFMGWPVVNLQKKVNIDMKEL